MSEETPKDPIGTLLEGAIQLHEIYESYIQAGFNSQQALFLCGKIVEAGVIGANQDK